jgi:hypothetical protein
VIGNTSYCSIPAFGLQCKTPRRDGVRIRKREQETPLTCIGLVAAVLARQSLLQLPLRPRKPSDDIPVCIFNESQSVRAAVTVIVKEALANRRERTATQVRTASRPTPEKSTDDNKRFINRDQSPNSGME